MSLRERGRHQAGAGAMLGSPLASPISLRWSLAASASSSLPLSARIVAQQVHAVVVGRRLEQPLGVGHRRVELAGTQVALGAHAQRDQAIGVDLEHAVGRGHHRLEIPVREMRGGEQQARRRRRSRGLGRLLERPDGAASLLPVCTSATPEAGSSPRRRRV
jgi:hypothetical protein